ncbi:MAG: polyprenyl synthetase family protein [Oscillibacter sp.]|jgi:geranylgeranyl pyrophosphate synthase|nr:polyprenyl synthetase family protein [Oscillibacter sp.]
MGESFDRLMEDARVLAETRLESFFPGEGLQEAMRYSLMAGGKRIRPILAMKFCEAAGGKPEEALDFGCGVEMLHTYSLIHDDLPCMDNDDLRRGKPTSHKMFGECTATLAGDALQAAAFQTVLSARGPWLGEGKTAPLAAGRVLAQAAGEAGMCGGQYLDTVGDGQPHTAEELTEINDKKTGALLRAACLMGVIASSGRRAVDVSCTDAAREYAANLGRAFQIRDDILDATSTAEVLGKNVGSDRSNRKTTYVTLLGTEECERRVEAYTSRAKSALDAGNWQGSTAFLRELADRLARRQN